MDDRRQELRLDDQEEEELDDRYLEVAELDDHLDLNAVAAVDVEQTALEPQLPQAQRLPQVLEEFAEKRRFVVQELQLEQVQALVQQQVLP